MPCGSHGSYTCKVCKDNKPSTLHIRYLDSDDEPQVERVPTPLRMAEFLHLERWGLTDEEFERVLQIFKRRVSITPGTERSYRLARSIGGLPMDFMQDIEASNGNVGSMRHTNTYKFVEAVADVVLSR